MAVGNNIYPPVVSPFSPNFVIGTECRIYFSISAYNNKDLKDYKNFQVSVTRQSDNISALDNSKYPSQIMLKPVNDNEIHIDENRKSTDKYYIVIKNDDIEGKWQTGVVYKVQIRFGSTNFPAGLDNTPQKLDAWLSANLDTFSEWSQVCLIQAINKPVLRLNNFTGGELDSEEVNILNIDTLEIVGSLDTDTTDPLRQYELILYHEGEEKPVETSGVLFPTEQSAPNEINYIFKTVLQESEHYTLEVRYMTAGLYEPEYPETYDIMAKLDPIPQLHVYIETINDYENGRIGVNIKTDTVAPYNKKVTIRRTSSESDFKLWEDVYTTKLNLDKLEFLWYDYTVKSGVWYKYCIQERDDNGGRGIVTGMDAPVMIEFDDMFLVADCQQIRLQFNPQIPSFQRVVNDSKVDTIGSKYPYIKRNGHTEYRQFQISGLISFLMDDYNVFLSRETYYGDNLELYKDFNDKYRIDDYNEVTWERDYREKVMDFLYKHNVKLFKSATEGNILVKLMDISFQPNQQLGRRIYTFSCTAYEIADNTMANIEYYNIQVRDTTKVSGIMKFRNDDSDLKSYDESFNGQWTDIIPANKEFIHANPQDGQYSVLEEYYKDISSGNYVTNVPNLSYLRIEMNDAPYLIYDNGVDEPQDYEATKRKVRLMSTSSMRRDDTIYLGYLAKINGKTIVIPQDGIYELKGANVEINSLMFARPTVADIQYQANITNTENTKKVVTLTNFYPKLGQEWGAFIPGQSLYQTLWDKYYSEHPGDYYTALVSINNIRVQANPGTVVYVREEGETFANRHVIGPTESLDFYSDESVIGDVYFLGAHFEQATDYEKERSILPEGKCNFTDIVVDSLDKIKPQDRYVYYLQSSNNTYNIAAAAALSSNAPEMVKLTTAKGLPIYTMQQELDGEVINIAIVDKSDYSELESYLMSLDYVIYITDSILFSDDQEIKVAVDYDTDDAIEFVLDNETNKLKMKAYQVLLSQYGDQQITVALKRQIWKDIVYTVSDYYIYYNDHWYVFDEDTHDAVCPVPASIDYICETMKAYYRNGGI